LLVAAAALLSGCQVDTAVSVTATPAGTGAVAVSVTFDKSAVAALGGSASLESGLDLSGLGPEGWVVEPPRSVPDGGVVLRASHQFATPEQAGVLLADLAGSGPAAQRPFHLVLSQSKSFWHVYERLRGTVDLECGLACFGDPGLRSALGSSTGVNPASLGAGSTSSAGRVFRFLLEATLPGKVSSTNALTPQGAAPSSIGTQHWQPALGQVTEVDLVTQTWNRSSVRLVVVASSLVVLALLSLLAWLVVRRWRRRRGRRATGLTTGQLRDAGVVTPSS
jgi:hypothetical protein